MNHRLLCFAMFAAAAPVLRGCLALTAACLKTSCSLFPQLQRSASEQATVRRVANQRFLTAMLDMGFRKDHAELALAETGNVGVEVPPYDQRVLAHPGKTPLVSPSASRQG